MGDKCRATIIGPSKVASVFLTSCRVLSCTLGVVELTQSAVKQKLVLVLRCSSAFSEQKAVVIPARKLTSLVQKDPKSSLKFLPVKVPSIL